MLISIVGAGPVGCRTAELLAKSGHEVQVFEEHAKTGVPEHCTGIVSQRLLELFKTKSVLNKAEKAQFFGENISFTVKGTAYMIDRQKFDQERFKAAKKAGADFYFNTRLNFNGKDLFFANQKVKTDMIIAADGSRSSVRSYFHPHYSDMLPAAQYLVSGKFNPKQAEIHFWPHYEQPGLFTWVVPQSGKIAKVGTACQNPKEVLDTFLKQKLPSARIRKTTAGTVVTGGIVRQDFGRVKLVGDAAGHVKATTGGGLVPGLLCAEKLAESINTGKSYSALCRPVLNQLRLAYWLRFVWDRLSPNTKETLLQIMFRESKYLEKADMDWHSSALMKIVAKELHLIPRIFLDLIV